MSVAGEFVLNPDPASTWGASDDYKKAWLAAYGHGQSPEAPVFVVASGSILVVRVVTGNEARPNVPFVFWLGGQDRPVNMGADDLHFASGDPADPALDTTPPSKVSGLASSAVGTTSFTLTWDPATDNVGVLSYEVTVNGAVVATVTTNTYTVTGRVASTSYTCSVRAQDAIGNFGAKSDDLVVTTPATPPPTVTHKVFAAAAPSTVLLGSVTQYSDGPAEMYVANSFYVKEDGWKCKGARVWVPAGATNLAVPIIARAYKTPIGSFIANYDAPTQTKTIAAPIVAGAWNEILFDTPFTFNRVNHATAPEKVWIAFNWNGNYLHSPGVNDTEVQASDGSLLFLSANPTPGSTSDRATNRAAGVGTGHTYYSVDIIAEK